MTVLSQLGLHSGALKGLVAVVTGAARGIGEHTAFALSELGAKVVLVDVASRGQVVAQRIQAAGGHAHFVHADLGEVESIDRLKLEAEAVFGPVDILINNAAALETGAVLQQSPDVWDIGFKTNLMGPLRSIQAIVPGMLARRRGVVISLISFEGLPFMGSYCANKMGLRSMMLSLGKEVPQGSGVSIFSVVPGAVDTPLAQEISLSLASAFGITQADVLASMANNPGYSGLVPVEHTAASLAWFCTHAPQFHGQFVDGYLPLSQAGVIDIGHHVPLGAEGSQAPARLPNPELDLKELIHINRSLENRIAERTRDLEVANQRLQEASLTDPLTGLWNRRYADSALNEEVAHALRQRDASRGGLFLVLLDIDHFKGINDTHGHHVGDAVLCAVSNILTEQTRATDKVIRWGGEEFLIVLRDVTRAQAEALVDRIRSCVAEHVFKLEFSSDIQLTCSQGFAAWPVPADGAAAMPWEFTVALADKCLYAAKRNGRNGWVGVEVTDSGASHLLSSPISWPMAALSDQGHLTLSSGGLVGATIGW